MNFGEKTARLRPVFSPKFTVANNAAPDDRSHPKGAKRSEAPAMAPLGRMYCRASVRGRHGGLTAIGRRGAAESAILAPFSIHSARKPPSISRRAHHETAESPAIAPPRRPSRNHLTTGYALVAQMALKSERQSYLILYGPHGKAAMLNRCQSDAPGGESPV